MPSLLILDDLDVVCPAAAGDGSEAPPGSTAARGCAAWLGAVMDEITVMRLPGRVCEGWGGGVGRWGRDEDARWWCVWDGNDVCVNCGW